ncbi:MAG: hypothetical protein WCQ99_03740 [Pseudomonadota bacterium]
MALALLTKEFAVVYYLILLFFTLYCSASRMYTLRKGVCCFSIVLAASCIVGLLFWLPYIINNIPWAPLQVVARNAAVEKNGNPDALFYFKILFNLYQHPWGTRYFGAFYYLAALSCLAVGVFDLRRSWPVIAWLVGYFFFLQWLGPWLAGRATCERMERFLIPLGLPGVLITARALGYGWKINSITKTILCITMLLLSYNLIQTTAAYSYPSEAIHLWDLKKAAKLLPKLTRHPVYADQGSVDKLRFLTLYNLDLRGYPPDQKNFEHFVESWVAFDLCDEAFLKGWISPRQIPGRYVEIFSFYGPKINHFKNYEARICWAP